jgi:protocatechuate 3,4-dioxygenase beta subunit
MNAGLAGGALLSATGAGGMNIADASCTTTPAQTPGPFYPGESKFTADNDLTQVAGRTQRAIGQIIYINGRVQDVNCQPIANVQVEIWQACASGRYNNQKDDNPASLDPNFKYWGETTTDEKGEFIFKTIKPVAKLGFKELITQMYFKGDALNDKDLILMDVPQTERASVIVDFQPVKDLDAGALSGEFAITIQAVGKRA